MGVLRLVGEGEDERDLTGPLALSGEGGADRGEKRVDDEEEALRIAERVLHPFQRRRRERADRRIEEPAVVLGAGARPEADAVEPEPDLDRFGVERGEAPDGV